jgi:spore germination protein KC
MIKKYSRLGFILILSLTLEGCWDYEDINRRSISLSIGLDKSGGKWEPNTEFAEFSSGLGKGKEGPQVPAKYHNRAVGKDFEEGRNEYDIKIPFVDFSGANRVIVFNRDYAQDGIEQYINRIDFSPVLRKSLLVVVSRETTDTLFEAKVINDISVGYAIEDTIRSLSKQGRTIYKTAQNIQSDIQFKDIGFLIPYVGLEENSIKYLGLAAMKDAKLVGIVDEKEARGFLFLVGKKPIYRESIINPDNKSNKVSIETMLKRRKIKTSYTDNRININISLNLDAKLQYEYFIEPISPKAISELEDVIAKELKNEVNNALEKSKGEFQSDVFGFAKYFRADNPSIYKQLKWKDEYPNVNFNVDVKVKVINTNLLNTDMKRKS